MKPNTQIVVISNTSNNLEYENKVWSDKVFLFEENTGKFKRGDNVRPYRDLNHILNNTVSDDIINMFKNANSPNGIVQLDDDGCIPKKVASESFILVDNTIIVQSGDASTADALYESYIKK